ncbi:MAG: thiamine phosphate synthase [Clostridia bacterium]
MKVDKKDMLLYAVTDRTWLNGNSLSEQVEQTIKAGATFIQLREKDLCLDEFVDIAKKIKMITDKYKIPFVVNDNVDVAVEVDADGVHVGQSDEKLLNARAKLGNGKIIGLSAHNVEEAVKAEQSGADYIGVGAVFNTSSKLDVEIISSEMIKNICEAVSIPVVAIGGIHKENILKLSGSGVDGVAVISAIFAQPDIEKATSELLELSKQMVRK